MFYWGSFTSFDKSCYFAFSIFSKQSLFKKLKMEYSTNDKIYHGCFYKNEDGTNKLILKAEECLMPTNNPFWKSSMHVPDIVRTRSQEIRQKTISVSVFNQYFRNLLNMQEWLKNIDSKTKISNEI